MLGRLRRPPYSAGSALLLLLVLVLSGCSSFGAPAGATEQGRDIHDLWRVFAVAAIIVGGLVYALIIWSLVRYRRRRRQGPDRLPRQFREHLPLEIVYSAVPVLIVAFLFAATATTDGRVTSLSVRPMATIEVQAFTWGWRFSYPGTSLTSVSEPGSPPPEMTIPVGHAVRIVLTSADVIHAFYVPAFLFKRDAIPGHPTEFDLTARRAGTFPGRCAEFCGLNHAFMPFTVRAVPADAFRTWLHRESEAESEAGS